MEMIALTADVLKKRSERFSWLQIAATKSKMMSPKDSHPTKTFSNMPITYVYVALREKILLKSTEIFSIIGQ